MNLTLPKIGVEGFIKAQAVKKDTGEIARETDWFHNNITNTGMDRLAEYDIWVRSGPPNDSGSGSGQTCFVGTGSTAPANTDTTLVSQIAKLSSYSYAISYVGSPDYYIKTVMTYNFGVGDAVGNVAEVGFSSTNVDSDLCVRELIRDGAGNPTTITVLADEFLRIIYEFRKYPPQGDFSGTTPEGVQWTARASEVDTIWYSSGFKWIGNGSGNEVTCYTGTMGATIEDKPSGTSDLTQNIFADSYTPGSYQRVLVGTIPSGDSNFNIKSMQIGRLGFCFQIEFVNTINKTNLDKIDLEFTIGWARKVI